MTDSEKLSPNGQRAVELFKEQLAALGSVRYLHGITPEFAKWKDSTNALFMKYLPTSPHFIRFSNIRFGAARRRSFSGRGGPSPQTMQAYYQRGCDSAAACLRGAIEDIQRFDVELQTQPSAHRAAALHISTNAPITINSNLAIAMDNATQNVSQVTTQEGAKLEEITALLKQSLELTGRQTLDAMSAINAIAVEMQKPKSGWNWHTILDNTSKLSAIMTLATDVSAKLAPHLQWIVGLAEQGKQILGR
jgi:hypothetical protein